MSTRKDFSKGIFTSRELTILKMIAQGLSSKDIAEKLGITFNTVETHRKNMLKKLNINTTAELIFISTSKGWLKLV